MNTSDIMPSHMRKVQDTLVEKGVTRDILQERLLKTAVLSDLAEAAAFGTIPRNRYEFRKLLGINPLPPKITLTVNYGMTLREMIEVGRYNGGDNLINDQNFPLTGRGIVEFEACLFCLGIESSPTDVAHFIVSAINRWNPFLTTLVKNPFRPAGIEHLLAFGACFPEEQRRYCIIALGSMMNSNSYHAMATCLRMGMGQFEDSRYLNLEWSGKDRVFGCKCQFLGVRRKFATTK